MSAGPVAERRALILSGSLGQGHDSVAEACGAALHRAGVAAETVDCMALLGGAGQRVGESAFRRLLAVPPLFDAFHFSHLRTGSALAARIEAAAAARLTPAVRQLVGEDDGGLLLSVFATGAGAGARVRAERPGWRSVVFCTDATAHRLWVHEGVDRYLVCSAAAAGTVRQFGPFADVVELTPPVRPAFFSPPERDVARAVLGVGSDHPAVLLMSGGWGLGPIASSARALAKAGFDVLAVAGRNRPLARRLQAEARAARGLAGTITAFGVTDRVPELMAACDVVVTSPGQTCHEARVVGRRQVILDVVPGHGRENLLLELAKGAALACPPEPDAVVPAVRSVLEGAVSEPAPWPLASPAEWDRRFLAAVGDLLVAGRPPGRAPARQSSGTSRSRPVSTS